MRHIYPLTLFPPFRPQAKIAIYAIVHSIASAEEPKWLYMRSYTVSQVQKTAENGGPDQGLRDDSNGVYRVCIEVCYAMVFEAESV